MSDTRRRVLIVDDETSLRLTLGANLELEGFDVHEAADANEALAALAREPFDLMVTDIRMPGMNGVELFQRVRRDHPGLPVLLMTAFAEESLITDALGDGAWAVLNKPFNVDHAIGVIRQASNVPSVLIVDSATEGQAMVEQLEEKGLKAHAVSSLAEALAALDSTGVDVCVLEPNATTENGEALLTRLRRAHPGLKGIVTLSAELPELVQEFAQLGEVAFLRKPISPPTLLRSIAHARAGRR